MRVNKFGNTHEKLDEFLKKSIIILSNPNPIYIQNVILFAHPIPPLVKMCIE